MNKEGIIRGGAVAAAGTIIFILLLTIFGELFLPLKDTLKSIFSHHWLGKSFLALIFFIITFPILAYVSPKERGSAQMAMVVLTYVFLTSTIALFLFFVVEYFHWF